MTNTSCSHYRIIKLNGFINALTKRSGFIYGTVSINKRVHFDEMCDDVSAVCFLEEILEALQRH